jgi:hypothetical protein
MISSKDAVSAMRTCTLMSPGQVRNRTVVASVHLSHVNTQTHGAFPPDPLPGPPHCLHHRPTPTNTPLQILHQVVVDVSAGPRLSQQLTASHAQSHPLPFPYSPAPAGAAPGPEGPGLLLAGRWLKAIHDWC